MTKILESQFTYITSYYFAVSTRRLLMDSNYTFRYFLIGQKFSVISRGRKEKSHYPKVLFEMLNRLISRNYILISVGTCSLNTSKLCVRYKKTFWFLKTSSVFQTELDLTILKLLGCSFCKASIVSITK